MGKNLAATFVAVQFVLVFEVSAANISESLWFAVRGLPVASSSQIGAVSGASGESASSVSPEFVLLSSDEMIHPVSFPRFTGVEKHPIRQKENKRFMGLEMLSEENSDELLPIADRIDVADSVFARVIDVANTQDMPPDQLFGQFPSPQLLFQTSSVVEEPLSLEAVQTASELDNWNQSETRLLQHAVESFLRLESSRN